MRYRPERPQMRGELSYLWLYVRTMTAAAWAAIARHSKVIIWIVCIGIYVAAAVLAMTQIGTESGAPTDSPTVPVTTEPITSTTVPDVVSPTSPALPAPEVETHVVSPGETLAEIALRYGVPFERIASDNALGDPNHISVGRRLRIGVPPQGVIVVQPGQTLKTYARSLGITLERLRDLNPEITNPDRILAGSGLSVG